MDEVAGGLNVGVDLVLFAVFNSDLGTNKNFTQYGVAAPFVGGGVDRKRDAVCRRGIVKKELVNLTNLFFGNEVNDDLIAGNF